MDDSLEKRESRPPPTSSFGANPKPAPMSSFGALAALAREDAARRAASDDDDGASDLNDDDDDDSDDDDSEPDSNDENDENGLGSASNASAVGDEPSEEDLVAALAAGVSGIRRRGKDEEKVGRLEEEEE